MSTRDSPRGSSRSPRPGPSLLPSPTFASFPSTSSSTPPSSPGRQRSSLPGSSTFRRLPTLTRSPFRRTDKHWAHPPDQQQQLQQHQQQQQQQQQESAAARVSTFPSLARVVVDDTSLSSALFGSPIPEDASSPPTASTTTSTLTTSTNSPSTAGGLRTNTNTSLTSPGAPVGSSSVTSPSSAASDVSSPQQPIPVAPTPTPSGASAPQAAAAASGLYPSLSPASPFAYKQSTRGIPMPSHPPPHLSHSTHSSHPSPLPAVGSSPSNASGFDLEPITYPAHLAQTRAPPPPPPTDNARIASSGTPPPPAATHQSSVGIPPAAGSERSVSGGTSLSASPVGGSGGGGGGATTTGSSSGVAATSPGTASSTPAAPIVPARSAHRYHRDFTTLGTSPAALVSAMNLATHSLPSNTTSVTSTTTNTPIAVNNTPNPTPSTAMQSTPSFGHLGHAAAHVNGTLGTPSIPQQQPSSQSLPPVTPSASTAAAANNSPRDPPGSVPALPQSSAPGTRRPSGSGSRKPSVSTQRRDKDDPDSTEESKQRRQNPDGTSTRVRRPPKARERDAGGPSAENGDDQLLTPILPNSKVGRAPASAMYFSPVAAHGRPPAQALRAHTGTLVGDRIWFLGGVDARSCWRGVASFDTESLQWSTVETHGEALPPLRAHTTTLVGDQLYIFGGGDGPTYSNDVWVFDTTTHRFSRPVIATARASLPPPRRAHTTVLYRNFLVVFGGGNGQAALNDVWALDVSDPNRLTWHEWRTRGDVPQKKGYHTANLIGDKMVVFGGSDGHASFADVHVLNLQTLTWTLIDTEIKHNRLSHTATQVGSYLFVIGGHNGQTYAQDVLLFNLVTLAWESKLPKGVSPPGRGYHVAVLHDARIFISGGYNGVSVFDDLWALDLGAGAYLPQVTTFEVDETADHLHAPPVPAKNGSANRI